MFARDLLADGLDQPLGDGDVTVRPHRHDGRDVLIIGLASPDGAAELEADAAEVRAFVELCESVLPRGRGGRHRPRRRPRHRAPARLTCSPDLRVGLGSGWSAAYRANTSAQPARSPHRAGCGERPVVDGVHGLHVAGARQQQHLVGGGSRVCGR